MKLVRVSWILLFLMGLLLLIFGISYIGFGAFSPGAYFTDEAGGHGVTLTPELRRDVGEILRSWGIFEAAFGLTAMLLSAGPYRRLQRWAWFALLPVPLALLGELANAAAAGDTLGPLLVFPVIAALGLLLPVRRFFRPAPSADTAADHDRALATPM